MLVLWHGLLTACNVSPPDLGNMACHTIESNTKIPPNSPCIFPFVFNNFTYSKCTWDASHFTNHKPWCSGETDAMGNHLTGQRKWANCASQCPVLPKRMHVILKRIIFHIFVLPFKRMDTHNFTILLVTI